MDFPNWLDTFLTEKKTNLEKIFEIEDGNGLKYIPCGGVIEHIKIAPRNEQKQIKNMLIKIDFDNKNEVDFFKHLAQAIAI